MAESVLTLPEQWQGHLLSDALNQPKDIIFSATFNLFDRESRKFFALPGIQITANLTVKKTTTQHDAGLTNSSGGVSFIVPKVAPNASLTFTCHVKGLTLNKEHHDADIDTNPASMLSAVSWGSFSQTYNLRKFLYQDYLAFFKYLRIEDKEATLGNSTAGIIPRYYSEETELIENLNDFEKSYDKADFNVLFEGDSWMHYPPNSDTSRDLFVCLDAALKNKLPLSYRRATFQHFGDTTEHMFGLDPAATDSTPPPERVQFTYTTRCLDNYDFKAIILSAGGNDIADPGISLHFDGDDYQKNIIKVGKNQYYDPYKAAKLDEFTSPTAAAKLPGNASYWLPRSFAALLKNHPWNLYLSLKPKKIGSAATQKTADDLNVFFDAKIQQLNSEMNLSIDINRFDTMEKAAREALKFPDPRLYHETRVDFPEKKINSAANDILDKVFDSEIFSKKFIEINQNLGRFLSYVDKTQDKTSIIVLAHTYCYPIFSEEETIYPAAAAGVLKQFRRGPWFHNRLKEANIEHRFIQAVAIKYLIDFFVWKVLEPACAAYPFFSYVDARGENLGPKFWNDEIHLKESGFEMKEGGFQKVATLLYAALKTRFPTLL